VDKLLLQLTGQGKTLMAVSNSTSLRICVFPAHESQSEGEFAQAQEGITTTILDIIHRPVFYLKQSVSETGFCLLLQGEPTQLGPVDRASLYTWSRRQNPVSETSWFK
jgi:hypothetical protein